MLSTLPLLYIHFGLKPVSLHIQIVTLDLVKKYNSGVICKRRTIRTCLYRSFLHCVTYLFSYPINELVCLDDDLTARAEADERF